MTDESPEMTAMNERLTAFMRELVPSPAPPPRYRYFQRENGSMYCWTVEKAEQDKCAYCDGGGEIVGDLDYETCPKCRGRCYVGGWYASFVYRAKGKGARSGHATRWELDQSSLVKHRKRKDAKGRALRLYRKAIKSK